MNNFKNWLLLKEEKGSNNKTEAMKDFVKSTKKVFSDYDLTTRKKVWEAITSNKGKELVNKIVKNPKTYLSNSEFIKLVQSK